MTIHGRAPEKQRDTGSKTPAGRDVGSRLICWRRTRLYVFRRAIGGVAGNHDPLSSRQFAQLHQTGYFAYYFQISCVESSYSPIFLPRLDYAKRGGCGENSTSPSERRCLHGGPETLAGCNVRNGSKLRRIPDRVCQVAQPNMCGTTRLLSPSYLTNCLTWRRRGSNEPGRHAKLRFPRKRKNRYKWSSSGGIR